MRRKKKWLALGLAAALACSNLPVQGIGITDVFAEEEAASDFVIDENGVLKKYKGAGVCEMFESSVNPS